MPLYLDRGILIIIIGYTHSKLDNTFPFSAVRRIRPCSNMDYVDYNSIRLNVVIANVDDLIGDLGALLGRCATLGGGRLRLCEDARPRGEIVEEHSRTHLLEDRSQTECPAPRSSYSLLAASRAWGTGYPKCPPNSRIGLWIDGWTDRNRS